jgi:hypothetical protein
MGDTPLEEIWDKTELEKQRDHILSEFNYHRVLDFSHYMNDKEKLPFISYRNVAHLRIELKETLDDFIHRYCSEGIISIVYNRKWYVGFTYEHNGETPYLHVAFRFEVDDLEASGYIEENS